MPIDVSGLSGSILKPASDKSQVQERGQETAAQRPADNASAAATDTVSLTGAATRLQGLESKIASLPVVDAEKVESIKTDLRSGNFEINPARVADKMMRFEAMLNSRE